MRRWQFVEQESRLFSGSEVAQLTPKAAAVLACLIRRGGETVSREDLLTEVWRGVHVTPDLVREYIFDLRVALGDDAKSPTYIETVRGKGFRLIGDVQAAVPDGRQAANEIRATVAVLRPSDFSLDNRWRPVADGIAEDVTTDLARFPDIAVVARHSSFAVDKGQDLRAAAAALNADYLLESSVTVHGDHLRAHFQLIDGATGKHVWADRFDRLIDSIPKLSGEITNAVANALGGLQGEIQRAGRRRARRKYASDLNAYENYLIACECEHYYDEEHTRTGLEHIEQSIAVDPEFARSWLIKYFLLMRGASLGMDGDPLEMRRQAHQAIERAYALDPRDPLILAQNGQKRASQNDIQGAIDMLVRAADFGRNQADVAAVCASYFVTVIGDLREARALIDQALTLNPTPPDWYRFAECRIYYFSGEYERCEMAAASAPNYLPTYIYGSLSQAMQGKVDQARQTYAALCERFPGFEFEQHARAFPIVCEDALERYRQGAEKLSN